METEKKQAVQDMQQQMEAKMQAELAEAERTRKAAVDAIMEDHEANKLQIRQDMLKQKERDGTCAYYGILGSCLITRVVCR